MIQSLILCLCMSISIEISLSPAEMEIIKIDSNNALYYLNSSKNIVHFSEEYCVLLAREAHLLRGPLLG